MVAFKELRDLALSLPEAAEEPHFEKTSFRIGGKIFATYDPKADTACVKLSLDDQALFSSAGGKAVYPVPNSWGAKGWTYVGLKGIDRKSLSVLVKAAYSEVSGKKKPKPAVKPGPERPRRK